MYKTSSFCKWDSPQCVKVAGLDTERIRVRDSLTGQRLEFTREEWAAFVEGVKAGEFDLMTCPELESEDQQDQI